MTVQDVVRLRELQEENTQLKHLDADFTRMYSALKDVVNQRLWS